MSEAASPALLPHHHEDLRKSGLTDATIRAAGYRSADRHEVAKLLGFNAGPGLLIPYRTLDGKPFVRVKPDQPPVIDGKAAKYLTPKGAGNRLYLPAGLPEGCLDDPSQTLLITEGEKKADKATQEGFPCLGLTGVWGWCRGSGDRGQGSGAGDQGSGNGSGSPDRSLGPKFPLTSDPRSLIPDLERVNWKGRFVTICYDSDLADNPDVKRAEDALAEALVDRGAVVQLARLPPGPDGAKQGLDDLLVNAGTESLNAVIRNGALWGSDLLPCCTAETLGRETRAAKRAWVVEKLIPEGGFVLLAGPPKRGKSLLTLNLAVSIARGEPFLGRETAAGAALLMSWEDPEALVEERVIKMAAGERPSNLHFSFPSAPLPHLLRGLSNLIRRWRVKLVVMDPWIYASGLEDENDNSRVGEVTKALRKLAAREKVALVAVHHTRKGGGEGGDAVRGAGALFGAADALMKLKGGTGSSGDEESVSAGELEVISKFGGREAIPLRLNGETLTWEATEAASLLKEEALKEGVVEFLTGQGEAVVERISEVLRVHRSRISSLLNDLLREGRVSFREEGRRKVWRLVTG